MKDFRQSNRSVFAAAIGACLVSILFFAGCEAKREVPKPGASGLPPASVRLQAVSKKSRPATEEVVGTVRAKLRANVEARVGGRIRELAVVLGQRVKAGDLVVRLEAPEVVARLDQAEAALDQAERDWKRVSALFEQQTVARGEYDAAQSRRLQAKGAVAEAKAMREYLDILAPFDGVVTKKWLDVGDLAAPGKPLVSIEDPASLRLEAEVPEGIAASVQPKARLGVRVDGMVSPLVGTVAEIAPEADPLSRTVLVQVDLPPEPGLRSGRFARLVVPVGVTQALFVPASAIVKRGQLEMLFVVQDRRAHLHLVKTGRQTDGQTEILSGLGEGEVVVAEGAAQLSDGQPVEAK